MKRCQFFIISLVLITISKGLLNPEIAGAEKCDKWVGKIVSIQGSIQSRNSSASEWNPVKLNDTYCLGDMIWVLKRSRASIVLRDESVLRLDQNTTIIFSGKEKGETSLIELLNGIVHFFSRVPRTLTVITPFVNGTVEGTEFLVSVSKEHTFISVFEGKVKAENNAGSLMIMSNQSASAAAGQTPVIHAVVRPRDAVQWALYYPSILGYRPLDFSGTDNMNWKEKVRTSMEFYLKKDFNKAFFIMDKYDPDIRDPRFFNYRAELLLSVGRVAEAKKEINQSLNLAPYNSDALALKSIIAVVQNSKKEALDLAMTAVKESPESATSHIALSYALQANFNLQEALSVVEKAVNLDPQNSLAHARLAELWLSSGYLNKALKAAKAGAEISPELSRTQTVLGFTYLTQLKLKNSINSFNRAIDLDQADPLPRLGLGIAKIRKGKLREGRQEIEIAASLDPGSSLIRSYLGKSYFDEKRSMKSADQFTMARELDPFDPTHFFYDSILKQSLNRPVEALHDIQKSIELNDNRAVYRSKLLLDEDLAARSASLARIYNNLGFEHLALVEGWKSVNIDPGEYSAHRFLADSYAALPRHEIARVSEMLQSQLLQPINITPVQPQLEESNLSILDNAGPGSLSFNEFNPLFNRNRVSLQASGIVGEHKTSGDELVVSGVYDNVSVSFGQFFYETEGYRNNNDLKQDIYNVFFQSSLSHKTSILTEFRSTDTEKGDLTLNFDPEDFIPSKREDKDSKSFRVGLKHSLTPHSDIIAAITYKDSDNTLNYISEASDITSIVSSLGVPFTIVCPATVLADVEIDVSVDDDGYMAEAQHLYRKKRFNTITGAGLFSGDRNTVINQTIPISCAPLPLLTLTPSTSDRSYIQHMNFYTYSNVIYPDNITWTIGGSVDLLEGGTVEQTKVELNPKLGITWDLSADTTLRTSAFRALTRAIISSQTIEPTQVAGFNQFFDDSEGTESWRYGIAVDHKFSARIYGGAEVSKRDMKVPFRTVDLQVTQADWREQAGHVYIYWTPHPWLALSSGYQYERLDRDKENAFNIEEVKTHSFPLGFNFYHPSGFSTQLTASFKDQSGDFQSQGSSTSLSGGDQFWLVDAAISYRLPRRLGLLTIGAKNLFDKSFAFQDSDPERKNPVIQPARLVYAKFTLAL